MRQLCKIVLHVFALMENDSFIDFKRSHYYSRVARTVKPKNSEDEKHMCSNEMDAITALHMFPLKTDCFLDFMGSHYLIVFS